MWRFTPFSLHCTWAQKEPRFPSTPPNFVKSIAEGRADTVQPYLSTSELIRPTPPRTPRKNNALRKFWPEGHMAKENRSKGALLRKSCLESSLSPKGYIAKARKHCKTRLKMKSSSFLSEGYVDKDVFPNGVSIRNFRRVCH